MLPHEHQKKAISERIPGHDGQEAVVHAHYLQLFDTAESLGASVAAFLTAGRALNERLLVLCTGVHWPAVAEALRARALDPDVAIRDGELTVLDADELLARITRRGQPSRSLFRQILGSIVDRLCSESETGARIYGELVELLAQEGNYQGAERLEQFWNELGREHPFTLLCGYSAAHFAAPDAGSALAAICLQHSGTFTHAGDALGHFLLKAERERADNVSAAG